MNKFILTRGQNLAVEEAEGYITEKLHTNKRYVVISGMGGSGKTTVAKYIIKKFKDKKIIGIATAHQAVKILKKGLGKRSITIAKALNKKLIRNKDTGRESFEIQVNLLNILPIGKYDIIIGDECSMYSQKDIDEIIEYANPKAKIILLGDIAQLPPINKEKNIEKSPTFDNIIAELDEPKRFKEPLTSLNLKIRQKILDYFYKGIKIDNDYSFDTDKRGLYNVYDEEALIRNFIGFYNDEDISSCKIIAYRNDKVDYYNRIIRLNLLGNNTKQIQIGDIIMANKPYNDNKIKNRTNLRVIDVKEQIYLEDIEIFNLTLKDEDDKVHRNIMMLNKSNMDGYFRHLNKLKEKRNFIKVGRFTDKFIRYSFNFASTSHTAQGSTIKNVFLDLIDIQNVSLITDLIKAQSIYVGIGRASEKLFVLKNRKI